MTDRFTIRKGAGTPSGEYAEHVSPAEAARLFGTDIFEVGAAAYTLTDAHHGRMVQFTRATAITVTIPAGLRPDFSMGWSQGGAGQITFVAADGVTLQQADGYAKSEKQFVMGGLSAFGSNVMRLYGRMAS